MVHFPYDRSNDALTIEFRYYGICQLKTSNITCDTEQMLLKMVLKSSEIS